ncbi:MAG: hypothetical protein ABIO26_01535 [Croceibacterium sp.]
MTVTVPRKPEYLNSCDCTLCFRLGTLTGYFDPAEVTIAGETRSFVRSDMDPPWLAVPFCPGCGAHIGWTALRPLDTPRMGVNMRLFDPDELVGIPVRFPNGREWNDEDDRPPPRHAEVPFARDAPF